jgi:hypothetical protein
MSNASICPQRVVAYPATPHKSVDYRAFKQGFQASQKQIQSLYMETINNYKYLFPQSR